MTCHSSHCFSIVWGQGNAMVPSLPSSCYTSQMKNKPKRLPAIKRSPRILGTLSNDDDDGSENVAKKMNLRSFKLNRVYLDPLNMSNAGDFSWSWIRKDFLQVQKEQARKIRRHITTSSIKRHIRFHVVVVQWTSKKCIEKHDASMMHVQSCCFDH